MKTISGCFDRNTHSRQMRQTLRSYRLFHGPQACRILLHWLLRLMYIEKRILDKSAKSQVSCDSSTPVTWIAFTKQYQPSFVRSRQLCTFAVRFSRALLWKQTNMDTKLMTFSRTSAWDILKAKFQGYNSWLYGANSSLLIGLHNVCNNYISYLQLID